MNFQFFSGHPIFMHLVETSKMVLRCLLDESSIGKRDVARYLELSLTLRITFNWMKSRVTRLVINSQHVFSIETRYRPLLLAEEKSGILSSSKILRYLEIREKFNFL